MTSTHKLTQGGMSIFTGTFQDCSQQLRLIVAYARRHSGIFDVKDVTGISALINSNGLWYESLKIEELNETDA